MHDNLSQRVREFCDAGGLKEYEDEVQLIFARIYEEGCRIASRYDDAACVHEFHPDTCLIRISFNKPFPEPVEMIWTILHEFGHHLAGRIPVSDKKDKAKVIAREREAWELARFEVLRYSRLTERIGNFDRYAAGLVEGYERVLGGEGRDL